jgi:hypothetical protein
VFRLALRQTEGLIGSIIRLLGLDLFARTNASCVFDLGRDREFADSPLEESGFEPLVPL